MRLPDLLPWPGTRRLLCITAAALATLAAPASGTEAAESAESVGSVGSVGSVQGPSLRFFGYSMVDCGVRDRFWPSPKTNYVTEVASFSNVGQLCVFDPAEDIGARLALMRSNRMLALLSVQALFFTGTPDATTGSGMRFSLRADHRQRWRAFIGRNRLHNRLDWIGAFYIADEPAWNGISAAELQQAADLVKSSFPSTPTMIIEAAPAIDALVVPASVDLVGFDRYGVPDPDTNPAYLANLASLKARRSRPDQRIVIVMEGQWLPAYDSPGHDETLMAMVAQRYHALAQGDPEVLAMLCYLWPGGFDDPRQKGSRNLPAAVIAEHVRIGRTITRK